MPYSDLYYGYVAFCHSLWIMLHSVFIKDYIALWHSSMVHSLMALSHCNIHWHLSWIETFHHCTFLNGFVALRQSSRFMLDFDVHTRIYWITTFINTYVGLRHSSIVHSLMVLLHWDIHHNNQNIYSWILKFIIPQCLSHIIRHHDKYIYIRLTKEMV